MLNTREFLRLGLLGLVPVPAQLVPGLNVPQFDLQLEAIRKRYRLPAIAAAAVHGGRIVEIATAGVRQYGEDEEVKTDDCWHIGSCTKSMTATLAAMLVEQGKLGWETTIADVFHELREVIDDDYEKVTLEQLLSHKGGAPGHAPDELWMRAWQRRGTPLEQRLKFTAGLITRRPEAEPGSRFIYSNQGYAIAGAMLERCTGVPYEQMLKTMLFEPLGMHTAGFGAPGADNGDSEQPWGHIGSGRRPEPVEPGPDADNPPAIAPAGGVHCSIADLARYGAFHAARGGISQPSLKPESFAKLHTRVPDENYALGWVVQERAWGGGDVLMHTGSNTMWYCSMWVAPQRNSAFVAATNITSELSDNGCDAAVKALVERVLGEE